MNKYAKHAEQNINKSLLNLFFEQFQTLPKWRALMTFNLSMTLVLSYLRIFGIHIYYGTKGSSSTKAILKKKNTGC